MEKPMFTNRWLRVDTNEKDFTLIVVNNEGMALLLVSSISAGVCRARAQRMVIAWHAAPYSYIRDTRTPRKCNRSENIDVVMWDEPTQNSSIFNVAYRF